MSMARGIEYNGPTRTDRISFACRIIPAHPIASADRILRIESIRDQRGREMRVLDPRATERASRSTPTGVAFPFGDPDYFGLYENQGWPTSVSIALDSDPTRVVSELELHLEMVRAEKIVPFDWPLTDAVTEDYIELVPGVHVLISKVEPQPNGKLRLEMLAWLHNKHLDITTMTPIVRTEADIRAGRTERRRMPPGNDFEQAPYLHSVEILDKHGRVLEYIVQEAAGLTHWTGQYWSIRQELDPIKGGAPPETLRIQLVTEISRSTIPFTFTDLKGD